MKRHASLKQTFAAATQRNAGNDDQGQRNAMRASFKKSGARQASQKPAKYKSRPARKADALVAQRKFLEAQIELTPDQKEQLDILRRTTRVVPRDRGPGQQGR